MLSQNIITPDSNGWSGQQIQSLLSSESTLYLPHLLLTMPTDMNKFQLVQTAKFSVLHPTKGAKPMKPIAAAKPAKKAAPAKKEAPKKAAPAPKKVEEEDDDDDDLFGDDDDEEEDEAAKALAAKRAEAAKAAKKEKKKPVERSQVVIEVKPWEAETDLEELAAKIKALPVEGLTWGEGHKLVPVAFGIKKLLVQCVIIDDLVLLDDITDAIEGFEDYVQSVDVASMNKL
ncbi:hypothetical protein PPTG_10455 [Phytophthora nicotianae INRA-310]|uniref:Translation elongation factor EF1B beta/delta subunit guanine nucleotide exchange domain-containing protein n=1 Tax=Phytophthora nicotianae (strain INRA-310) TaxID=761204 RepID=W2QEJ5_PHYN3|nr:hypothetical protein PPTG_10455 [Phytophthora nicotianae INRA-310]ETN11618.1 hypothetical protein PPTG_10455 [Phytophthora nicotianae INRA-310]